VTDTITARAAASRRLKRLWWECRDGHRERITRIERQRGGPNIVVAVESGRCWLADPDRVVYRKGEG
jgi:hypothetical protein